VRRLHQPGSRQFAHNLFPLHRRQLVHPVHVQQRGQNVFLFAGGDLQHVDLARIASLVSAIGELIRRNGAK
jgi:hypothetical protein